MRAPIVFVRDDGQPCFEDGRHRFALLRDRGLKTIPIAMELPSVERARSYGYLGRRYKTSCWTITAPHLKDLADTG
jgi:hypothetical protein